MAHNKRIIHHFGLRRSGTHAIIEWLAFHEPGLVGLTNSVMSIPVQTFKSTHFWLNREDHPKKEGMRIDDHGNATIDKDLLIISYEDIQKKGLTLREARRRIQEGQDSAIVGTWDEQIFVATIRSIYNNAASRMAINESRLSTTPKPHGYTPEFVDWWKSLARESLEGAGSATIIQYDRWFANLDYRRILEIAIGLPTSAEADEILAARVANRSYGGHGSSFDRHQYDGKAAEMDVLERYRSVAHLQEFRELLQDDEARELNFKLFGWTLRKDGSKTC